MPLEACLSSFSAPEEVHDFHSTALNAKTTAIKYVYSIYFSFFFIMKYLSLLDEELYKFF